MTGKQRRAVIIGAGPAGLTAALELARRTDVQPLVLEGSDGFGGISRTFVHNGNRIDLGGHRFFSKSDRVMDWWTDILPIAADDPGPVDVSYQRQSRQIEAGPDRGDNVMLVRNRVSRILFRGQFFDYPLSMNPTTVRKLGIGTTMVAGFSYLWARAFPVKPERTLEDFVINRFGRYLYGAFFRDYTEKVWGVPCREIPADWGAQRIKGLSITKVVAHALRKVFGRGGGDHRQKGTETSLIERFLYPKFGPGHMWEQVAARLVEAGGEIRMRHRVVGLETGEGRVTAVLVENAEGGQERIEADFVFSTMAVKDLVDGLSPAAPPPVREVAGALPYRDFMTVGILARRLAVEGGVEAGELGKKLPDNWIYVQEPHVKVGRIQVFNNWSPYLVADPKTVWIGLEYFVNEGDEFWCDDDEAIKAFAVQEMEKIGFLASDQVLDSVVIRQKKAYPAYFGSYEKFSVVRDYLDGFANLYPLGRNGQHRYNNQDHSMLTAMIAVDGIAAGRDLRAQVWNVNTEDDYHEEN